MRLVKGWAEAGDLPLCSHMIWSPRASRSVRHNRPYSSQIYLSAGEAQAVHCLDIRCWKKSLDIVDRASTLTSMLECLQLESVVDIFTLGEGHKHY